MSNFLFNEYVTTENDFYVTLNSPLSFSFVKGFHFHFMKK